MSFLFPLFLVGGLAIAVPLYLHLVQRRPIEERPWSSLLFLTPSRPRHEGRRRLRDRVLLLLRCLCVVLIALAFARPFRRRAVALSNAPGARVVVLLDASASMRRGRVWADAVDRVRARLRAAGPNDRVGVWVFDDAVRPVLPLRAWAANAGDADTQVRALRPSWGATDIGRALEAGVDALTADSAEGGGAGGEIVLVSDMQEGARLDAAERLRFPEGVALRLERVSAAPPENLGLAVVPRALGESPADATHTRVRVSLFGGTRKVTGRVRAAESPTVLASADLAPGESRVLDVTLPDAERPWLLHADGDAHDFDNTVAIAPVPPAAARVLIVGTSAQTDDPKSPAYFLSRALLPTRVRAPSVIVRAANDVRSTDDADLVIVTKAPAQPAALTHARLLLWTLDSADVSALAALTNRPALRVREASSGRAALVHVNTAHPLLAPFADPRFGDFSKVRAWHHRVIDESTLGAGVEVLARFDDGSPAWLLMPAGSSRVFVMTSAFAPSDGQLVLSSKFVPLLQGLLDGAAGTPAGEPKIWVGDAISLRASARAVRTPDGREVAVAGDRFVGTDAPGLYTIVGESLPRVVAVRLHPSESATTPLPDARLLRFTSGTSSAAGVARLQGASAAALEQEQRWWRPLLFAALCVLALESAVAAVLARSRRAHV